MDRHCKSRRGYFRQGQTKRCDDGSVFVQLKLASPHPLSVDKAHCCKTPHGEVALHLLLVAKRLQLQRVRIFSLDGHLFRIVTDGHRQRTWRIISNASSRHAAACKGDGQSRKRRKDHKWLLGEMSKLGLEDDEEKGVNFSHTTERWSETTSEDIHMVHRMKLTHLL